MLTRPHPLRTAVLFCGLAAGSALAQETIAQSPSAAPANLAYVEGSVDLVHEGAVALADPPMILVDGDVVRTQTGRAEIVFADGTLLHLDSQAELEILAPERIRLLNGRAMLRVSAAAARPYFVDTPAATVRFDSRGEYGVAANLHRGDLEVTVARGIAEIDDGSQRSVLRAGEMLTLAARGTQPLLQPFNSAVFDAFAQWSNDRTNGFSTTQSAAQLPSELRPYAPMLDQYGRWDHVAPYGDVWFPSVGAGWRPYYDGWWDHTSYGWTWYGRDRWAWPTHHYGRWGFNGSFWFWIPANVWGPAWVSWGIAPGYVSWSPLGWDGRPVIGFGGYRSHLGYGLHDPWRSWTVVPRDHFGRRRLVRTHAINADRLDERTRRSWIVQNTPPASPPGSAVRRGTVSLPGTTGNVRRADPNGTRQGNVRRPQTAETAGAVAPGGSVAPGASASARPRSEASSGETSPKRPEGREGGPVQRLAPAAPLPSASARPRSQVGSGETSPNRPEAREGRPVAPGYRARPGTERPAEAEEARRGGTRSRDPQYVATPPPAAATDPAETGAQPRDGDRSRPAPYPRSGARAEPDPPSSQSGERGGSVRGAEPRNEPRAASPRSEGARESGGARQRGGSVAAPPQGGSQQGGQQGGASGGAARRRPGN